MRTPERDWGRVLYCKASSLYCWSNTNAFIALSRVMEASQTGVDRSLGPVLPAQCFPKVIKEVEVAADQFGYGVMLLSGSDRI